MTKWPIVLVVGLTSGLVGPRMTGPNSRPAGEPFDYVPPEGFSVRSAASTKIEAAGARAWESPADDPSSRAVVVLHHSALTMQVDEPSLAKMVGDMPQAFEDCTWVHRRHETRSRSDGARVGLIEGDCDRTIDLSPAGLPNRTARTRKLQLLFPETEGTSIATASYPADEASRWEPAFVATIDRARGVALRVPAPPLWQHGLWGAAGLLLAALAASLVRRPGT
jgi:hypothetical protein